MASRVEAAEPVDGHLRTALQKFAVRDGDPPDTTARVAVARVPLASGGVEILAYLSGHDWCGSGGCHLVVLQPWRNGYRVVTDMTISLLPIRVLSTSNHGRPDIGVWQREYGIYAGHGYEARLRFDGKSYPDNPSVPPAIPLGHHIAGRVVISRDDNGEPLYP